MGCRVAAFPIGLALWVLFWPLAGESACAASLSVAAGALDQPQPRQVPENAGLVWLVRATIIALDQANKTGNYTVFRQLASHHFQDANSAEQLNQIFKAWRLSDIDLTALAGSQLRFARRPVIDGNGRLLLSGTFAGTAVEVQFELSFSREEEHGWGLYAIKLVANPAKPARFTRPQRDNSATVEPAGAPAILPPDISEIPVPRRWPRPHRALTPAGRS